MSKSFKHLIFPLILTAIIALPTINVMGASSLGVSIVFTPPPKSTSTPTPTPTSTPTPTPTLTAAPTPVAGRVAPPVADLPSGQYSTAQTVKLSSTTSNSRIYYTVNGRDPNDRSTLYTQPIVVNESVTIKAIAEAPGSGLQTSRVSEFKYEIKVNSTSTPTPTPAAPPASGYKMVIKLQIGKLNYTRNDITAYFDVEPYIDPSSSRTMVPIRFIAEALGANVEWDNPTQTDTITMNGRSTTVTVGRPLPNNMGTAVLRSDRLFVPIRYVSEELGAIVGWDATTQTVTISM